MDYGVEFLRRTATDDIFNTYFTHIAALGAASYTVQWWWMWWCSKGSQERSPRTAVVRHRHSPSAEIGRWIIRWHSTSASYPAVDWGSAIASGLDCWWCLPGRHRGRCLAAVIHRRRRNAEVQARVLWRWDDVEWWKTYSKRLVDHQVLCSH